MGLRASASRIASDNESATGSAARAVATLKTSATPSAQILLNRYRLFTTAPGFFVIITRLPIPPGIDGRTRVRKDRTPRHGATPMEIIARAHGPCPDHCPCRRLDRRPDRDRP